MAKSFGQLANRHLRVTKGRSDSRKGLIGAIHAAAHKAGLDEETRRALQERVTGKTSCAAMTAEELNNVLDELNKSYSPSRCAAGAATGGMNGQKDRTLARSSTNTRPHLAKIKALWWDLYWLGAIDHPDVDALSAFVKRQTGIERLEWLTADQASSVIEALKDWLGREGVDWTMAHHRGGQPEAVLQAIWDKLFSLGAVKSYRFDEYFYIGKQMPANPGGWSSKNWNEAVKIAGKKLRRVMGQQDA